MHHVKIRVHADRVQFFSTHDYYDGRYVGTSWMRYHGDPGLYAEEMAVELRGQRDVRVEIAPDCVAEHRGCGHTMTAEQWARIPVLRMPALPEIAATTGVQAWIDLRDCPRCRSSITLGSCVIRLASSLLHQAGGVT